MIQIRQKQIDALSESLVASFVARTVEHLKSHFPDQLAKREVPSEFLDTFVRRGISRANEYGVVNNLDVRAYIECMLLLGPNFERDSRYPWAAAILSRDDLTGFDKMEQISSHLTFGQMSS